MASQGSWNTVFPWVDAFLCLRDRKIILLAQIKFLYEHEWIKSYVLITQWLIFAVLNFAGVFFLLELIFADQVPSTTNGQFRNYRKTSLWRIFLSNVLIAMFFSERWKTRNLELMMYLKRDAELWTMYNKFEVWSISDTPTLQRIFLVFFLLVLFSVEKDRKYSVLRRVKLFFPDRHFLVKYGICLHRAISPGIWATK